MEKKRKKKEKAETSRITDRKLRKKIFYKRTLKNYFQRKTITNNNKI
jgi:hypothetical protein